MANQIAQFSDFDGLTSFDLIKLSYPFQRQEHEFLQGMVYIRELAITNRLEKIDPSWEFMISKYEENGNAVVAVSSLRIKGVVRTNVGGGTIMRMKRDGTELGDGQVAENTVNAYKAAATDALKRCSRLFGIGRYLLAAPKEGAAFDAWLVKKLAEAKVTYDKLNITVDSVEVAEEEKTDG